MKGYKAFEKGLICQGKKYAENTIFEEEKAEICESGMHFCANPLDCLDYYPLIDDAGNLIEFAEVEALDEVVTNDNKKFVTRKLKIGAKIKIENLLDVAAKFMRETITEDTKGAEVGEDEAKQVGGNYAQQVGGNYAQQVGGYAAQQVGGDSAQQVGGDYAQQVGGDDAILVNGAGSIFKAGLRSIIICYEYKNGELQKPVVGYIDGKTLKADTFYKLKNGEFVEANL